MGLFQSIKDAIFGKSNTELSPEETPPIVPISKPKTRFDECLAWVLEREGGFVNNPNDPGGATNKGITVNTLSRYMGRLASIDDVKNLSNYEVASIYKSYYWLPIMGDYLPRGIDLVIFDHAVTSGTRIAKELLQRAVNVPADGIIGPVTLNAINKTNVEDCIALISKMRCNYYRGVTISKPETAIFLNGWLSRVNLTKTKALLMLQNT